MRATSTDGSSSTNTFTITLQDLNETGAGAISDTDAAADGVDEGATNGTSVGITAHTTDPDGTDTITYSLDDDANGRFAIDETTGEITVADNTLLDHESDTSHTVSVRATSSDGSSSTRAFSIDVNDVNEAPTDISFSGPAAALPTGGLVFHLDADDVDGDGSTANNPGDGTQIGAWNDLSSNGFDGTATSSMKPVMAENAINGHDAIDFSTGNDGLTLPDNSLLNTSTYSQKSFAVAFETGSDVSGFQVIYEQGGGTRGYSLSIAADPNNGNASTLFACTWNTAEWDNNHDVKTINLGEVDPNTTYTVAMVHDATGGTLEDRTFSAYVNGDHAGTLTHVDVQKAHSGNPGVGAYMDGTKNPVTGHNYGGNGGYFAGSVGEVVSWNAALDANQLNEANAYLQYKWAGVHTVAENAADGTVVATVSATDPDAGESFTFALTDDAGGRFVIDENSGEISVADGSLLNHAAATSHEVSVEVTDTGGNTYSETLSIDVGDIVLEPDGDYDSDGTPTDDAISGGSSADTLYGGAGDDTVDGAAGDDIVYGGSGNDTVSGGDGNDTVVGGIGDDTLSGGTGEDTLYGGDGSDTLTGGAGDDVVYGQAGNDLFILGEGDGDDTVYGGDAGGWTDVIDLSGVDVDALAPGWLTLTSGTVDETGADYTILSEDAAGTVMLNDGSVMTFEGIERVEW